MSKKVKAVRYDELQGKVVSAAGYGLDSMLISFTDGTVLALSVDDDGLEFSQTEIDLLSKKWRYLAEEAELITVAEYKAAEAAEDARKVKQLERELAALKSKGKSA